MGSRVHLSADWLEKFGGAEKVASSLLALYPESKIAALWNDSPEIPKDRSIEILGRPRSLIGKASVLPRMPSIWSNFDFQDDSCKTLLSTSHLFAHHVSRSANSSGANRIAYIHTPARYIWEPKRDSRASWVPSSVINHLRKIDFRAAEQLDGIIANSEFTKEKIFNAWGRTADRVIHPPIDLERIRQIQGTELTDQEIREIADLSVPTRYFVAISRLVPYKRLDLAIKLSAKLGLALAVIGSGPDLVNLQHLANRLGAKVVFMGGVSDKIKFHIAEGSEFLYFPGIEDFGIVPVEMFALGVPVIAANAGGAKETVQEGVNGFLTDYGDVDAATSAVRKISRLSATDIQTSSLRFDKGEFAKKITEFVGEQ